MNFSQEIINVLNYLGQKFGIAIDWTSENVIPYLQDLGARYIKYEAFTSIAWMVVIPVITIIIAIPLVITHKKANACGWDDNHHFGICCTTVILWILFLFMVFTSICVVCTQVFDIIECYTLPEKVIFEYVKTLMQSTS